MDSNGIRTTLLALLFFAALLGLSSLYVVHEGQHAILLRLGRLVKDKDGNALAVGPGLHTKYPFVNTVRLFDTRIQTLDIKPSPIVTREKKNVIVDYYVKWRIHDLDKYYRATDGNEFNAESLLEPLLNTSLRAEFGKRTISELVSSERDDVMAILQKKADKRAANLGLDIIDVRIKGIELPETTRSTIYQFMRADMEKIANKHRADGKGRADAIRAHADKEANILLAEAKSNGEKIRAQGQAKAAEIYANAYNNAPEFYAFYRSLKAYENTFSSKDDILVLNQKSQFFDYFTHSGGVAKGRQEKKRT